jgi:hypothetical protein
MWSSVTTGCACTCRGVAPRRTSWGTRTALVLHWLALGRHLDDKGVSHAAWRSSCALVYTLFQCFFAYLLVLSLFPPLPPLLSSSPRPNLCYLLGSPSFGLPLGSPCALVYTLSQCFFATSGMVLYLARLASACLWVRPVRSFTHFSNCFLLLLEWCCTWLALLWLGSLGSGTCLGSLAGVGPETRACPSILVLAWDIVVSTCLASMDSHTNLMCTL